MKQLTLLSGKGGTGKTSILAAIAALAGPLVAVDCDVDAADLHLVLTPEVKESGPFEGGQTATIDSSSCIRCELCRTLCRFDAINEDFEVNSFSCEGCGVCQDNCPEDCITLNRETAGQWFLSETRFGPMVHAKMGIAQENSGKLVAFVREQARKIAEERGLELVLIDGSPGIGCPVISSITGVDRCLIITEPTLSGLHDLKRVLELTDHFNVPASVCINKFDLNPEMAEEIEAFAIAGGAEIVGRIPYDNDVLRAMVARKTLPEFSKSPASLAVAKVWDALAPSINLRTSNTKQQ